MFGFLKRPAARSDGDRVCYLHIGPHKTGSTSLQHLLVENAAALARLGLAYPIGLVEDPRRRKNHTPLARRTWMRHPGPLHEAPVWSDFDAALKRVEGSIIVSSEHFGLLTRRREWFNKIVAFFERHGFRIIIIAYVRDQPLWLNSWYTQHQKTLTGPLSFEAFSAGIIERGHVNPWKFLGRALTTDGIEVRAVPFEHAAKTGLGRSFLDALGVPDDFAFREPPKINPNFGVKGMFAAQEIMRRITTPVRRRPDYVPVYERFLAVMRGRDWDAAPYVAIDQAEYDALRARFYERNDRFSQAFFGRPWAELSPERTVTRATFDFDAADPADRADVLEVVDEIVALIEAGRGATP